MLDARPDIAILKDGFKKKKKKKKKKKNTVKNQFWLQKLSASGEISQSCQ